jgi:hypothetical protein
MTMAFKAPKGGVGKDVKEGTSVRFEFVLTPQGEMQLTSIVPVPAGAAAAPADAKPAAAGGGAAHAGHATTGAAK